PAPLPLSLHDALPIYTVALAGTHLSGTTLSNPNTTNFVGTIVNGTVADEGQSFTMAAVVYIESISTSASDPEILHYIVKAYHRFVPAPGRACIGKCPMIWDYICGSWPARRIDDNGGIVIVQMPYPASAVGGQWDYHQGVEGGGRKV